MTRFFSLRTQLFILSLAGLVFLVLYKLVLAGHVGAIIADNKILCDRIYYQSVFDHLPWGILIFTAIILLVVLLYRHIRAGLLWFVGREKLLLGLCGAIIVIVQLVTIFKVTTVYSDDSLEYLKLSDTLVLHHAYVSDLGYPTSYWPVGYPAYLALLKALFGDTILAAHLMNVLITLGLVFTLYAVFKSWLVGQERVAFIVVTALFPNTLFSSNVVLSDYLFTLLLWLAVLMYLRRDRFRYSIPVVGLILAFASYLRPIGLLLPVIFFFALWKEGGLRTNRRGLVVGLLVFILALTPWTLRNYSVFGTFVPVSTNGGYNFLMGNRTGAPGGVNHDFSYNTAVANEAQESSNAIRTGIRDILRNPIEAIGRLPRKIFELYRRGDSSLSWALKRTEVPLNPLLLSVLFYATNAISYFVIYISLLTVVAYYFFDGQVVFPPLPIMLYGYVILVTLVFVGSERYLIPVFPVHQFLFAKFISRRMSQYSSHLVGK